VVILPLLEARAQRNDRADQERQHAESTGRSRRPDLGGVHGERHRHALRSAPRVERADVRCQCALARRRRGGYDAVDGVGREEPREEGTSGRGTPTMAGVNGPPFDGSRLELMGESRGIVLGRAAAWRRPPDAASANVLILRLVGRRRSWDHGSSGGSYQVGGGTACHSSPVAFQGFGPRGRSAFDQMR